MSIEKAIAGLEQRLRAARETKAMAERQIEDNRRLAEHALSLMSSLEDAIDELKKEAHATVAGTGAPPPAPRAKAGEVEAAIRKAFTEVLGHPMNLADLVVKTGQKEQSVRAAVARMLNAKTLTDSPQGYRLAPVTALQGQTESVTAAAQ